MTSAKRKILIAGMGTSPAVLTGRYGREIGAQDFAVTGE